MPETETAAAEPDEEFDLDAARADAIAAAEAAPDVTLVHEREAATDQNPDHATSAPGDELGGDE